MSVLMDPDCLDGKHRSCNGGGWCEATDRLAPCPCECHGGPVGTEHFPGCPCGACQNLRTLRPVTHAMQAKHLSGASIGKLVEYSNGRSLTTNEHQWSPAFKLQGLTHTSGEVELEAHGGNYELRPDDWVRVTQVAA